MKIGITFSAFDLLHAGHIKMLEAKGNVIFNCRSTNGPTLDRPEKNSPQSVVERYIQLKAACMLLFLCDRTRFRRYFTFF
jgi:glycerol-3-phosphate cytidylyltransferase